MEHPAQSWAVEIRDFFARLSRTPHGTTALDGLLALLVTDLAGFTPLVERLGDRRSQRVIQHHNRALRACIEAHRGVEVAHLGDGLLGAFRSVSSALQCARAMQASSRANVAAIRTQRCTHAWASTRASHSRKTRAACSAIAST